MCFIRVPDRNKLCSTTTQEVQNRQYIHPHMCAGTRNFDGESVCVLVGDLLSPSWLDSTATGCTV